MFFCKQCNFKIQKRTKSKQTSIGRRRFTREGRRKRKDEPLDTVILRLLASGSE